MIAQGTQGVRVESACRRVTRIEIAWDVAGEGLSNAPEVARRAIFGDGGGEEPREAACDGVVRVVVSIEPGEGEVASALIRIERDAGSRRVAFEVARVDQCVRTHDERSGLVHIDGGVGESAIAVTMRECRDGVTLLYARSGVFEMLGVPGGRVESPALRVVG